MVWGWAEGVEWAVRRVGKGRKIRTTVIAKSVKYNLKKDLATHQYKHTYTQNH